MPKKFCEFRSLDMPKIQIRKYFLRGMQHLMSAGCVGHFPDAETPDLQLQVHVPPEPEQADS